MNDPSGASPRGGERHDCGLDVGAFVLGALDPHESARFRAHLESCAVCRDEVRALRAAAEALPLSVPQLALPHSLRSRVLAEIRRERRARPVARGRGRGERFRGARAWAPALAGGLALLAAGIVAATAPWERSSGRRARVITASVAAPGARATLLEDGARGELVIGGLSAPPAGRIYEVWVKRASAPPAPTSALFDVTRAGSAAVSVPGSLRGVSEVLVTAEPRGGSARPTRAPVIRARLS